MHKHTLNFKGVSHHLKKKKLMRSFLPFSFKKKAVYLKNSLFNFNYLWSFHNIFMILDIFP